MRTARDNFSAGRLMASIVLALVAMGAVHTHFALFPPTDPFAPTRPVYLAGGAAGWLSGWWHLGPQLGRGFRHSGLMGLGALGFGIIYFTLMLSAKSTFDVYGYSSFDTVMAFFNHLITKMLEFLTLIATPTILSLLFVGALSGSVFAEHFNRVWR